MAPEVNLNEPSTQGRVLLQERLTLFGRWFFVVAFGYYLSANLPLDYFLGYPFDWVSEWFGAQERLTLGVVACAAIVWLATRGRPLTRLWLEAVDAFSLVGPLLFLAGAAIQAAPPRDEILDLFTVLLAATNIIVVRAIVVPSTARRTILISAIAFLPVLAAIIHSAAQEIDLPRRGAENLALTSALWGVVAVLSGGMISRVLFRLRREIVAVRRLGPYTLQGKIGQGAAGMVFRAHHVLLRRPTAVKLLAPEKNSEADLRRFEREVQLTARLTHPNTVAVYDYGRSPDGVFYYAMELIEGISLEQLVAQYGPQPAWRVVHILRQACGALDEAHRIGLIHRDIKPANLMVCARAGLPDVVKVVDFGLVKPIAGGLDGAVSMTQDLVGTPLYMSPEAIRDPTRVNARSDLYSLAATGCFLLAGSPPFTGRTVIEVCSKHLSAAPEPPSRALGQPIDDELEALLMRCLAKEQDERPASAGELERLLAGCAPAREWSAAWLMKWWDEHQVQIAAAAHAAEGPRTGAATLDVGRERAL